MANAQRRMTATDFEKFITAAADKAGLVVLLVVVSRAELYGHVVNVTVKKTAVSYRQFEALETQVAGRFHAANWEAPRCEWYDGDWEGAASAAPGTGLIQIDLLELSERA